MYVKRIVSKTYICAYISRGVNTGGAGGAMATPVFSLLCSESRNLLSQLYKSFLDHGPPGFFDLFTPLLYDYKYVCKVQ